MDIQKYNQLEDELAESKKDYEKVMNARQVLEDKLRYYKDMTKQWREYTKKWIPKYPNKQPKLIDPLKPSQDSSVRDPRSSSAPAPPPIPDGMTPSVSDWSRSASPWTGAGDLQPLHREPDRNQSKSPKLFPDKIIPTQSALKQESSLSSEDPTEASDEFTQKGLESLRAHRTEPASQKSSCLQNGAEDSPIIIFERPVNRKKPTHIQALEDSRNPSCVKGEPKSSSPLRAPNSFITSDPHESLDLDDNGAHVDTPRKRRKLEQIQLRSTLMPSEDHWGIKEAPVDEIRERQGKRFLAKDADDQNATTRPRSPSCFFPEERKNDANDGGEGQSRRLRKASSRAQQQAHNKRVQERLEAAAQSTTNDALSKYPNEAEDSHSDILASHHLPHPGFHTKLKTTDPQPHALQDRHKCTREEATQAIPVILQPRDSNANILPRTTENLANQKSLRTRRRQDKGAAYVPALAEDGESSPSRNQESVLSPDRPSKASDAHQRLGTLLSGPSPVKSVLESDLIKANEFPTSITSKTPLPRPDQFKESKAFVTPLSEPAKESIDQTRNKIGLKQYKSAEKSKNQEVQSSHLGRKGSVERPLPHKLRSMKPPAENGPEHEPLRARPILRLGIDDFKLNPAHSEYAYHESIRKHDEKKVISGCTDRNCLRCKDIRKFVESSGYAQMPGQSSEEADRRLVKDFLGIDDARLEKMTAEERKEIWIQARIQQFADKFGKHRTNFGRATSPVDFWNTDFPTSQEHERNREAARQREREKVEQMYYEAIKKGGRYVFADE